MVSKKELIKKNEKLEKKITENIDERQEIRRKFLGAEAKIMKLEGIWDESKEMAQKELNRTYAEKVDYINRNEKRLEIKDAKIEESQEIIKRNNATINLQKEELKEKEELLEVYRGTKWDEYIFLTVDAGHQNNPEQREKNMEEIRHRADAEFKRVGITASPVILPSTVKAIDFHSQQKKVE